MWTIGKKLYLNVAALSLTIVAIVGAFVYVQDQLSDNLELATKILAENLHRSDVLTLAIWQIRAANRQNVIFAAQKNAAGIEKNRKQIEEQSALFIKTSKEIADSTKVAQVKADAEAAPAAIKDFIEESQKDVEQ